MSIVSVFASLEAHASKAELADLAGIKGHDVSLLKQAFANVLVMGHYETALNGLPEAFVQGFLS